MGLTNFEQMLVDSNGNYYGVSGSMVLPVGAIGQLVAGVNGATGLVEYLSSSGGALVVTGSVQTSVTFPSSIGVFPTSPSGFWHAGAEGVTGSVNVYTSGPQAVSGTVQAWIQGPVAVSGSIHTGSTANGFPVTVGGVYYGSGNVGSLPAYVQSLQVDPSGSLYITTSGSLPVTLQGNSSVSVNNFPTNQQVWTAGPVGVTGSVAVTTSGPLQVWTEGATGVTGSVNVFTSGPQAVSGTVQIWSEGPLAVTGAVNVYTSGPQAVSSSSPSGFWFAGTVGVSGSYQSGSVATAPVFPVLEAGLDTSGVVRPFLTDPQGRLTNPTTGSNITSIAATTGNTTVLSPNNQRAGGVIFNEGPATAFVKFGANATQSSYTVQVATKGYYEIPFTYQGRIDATFSTNTGNLRVTELT